MTYLYPNDWQQAHRRLKGLESIEDEHTFRHLDRLGVGAGWRCLEVGAGAGSVAGWLCERVGAGGHVVGTDIDTRLLRSMSFPQLEVRLHDIAKAALETDAFELVHARHVLIHLPTDCLSSCLRRLVESMAEGGYILLEESDFATNCPEPSVDKRMRGLYREVMGHIHRLYEARGMALHLGSRLFGMLETAGVSCGGSEARMRTVRGGSAEALFHKTTYTQLREEALDSGELAADRYDDFLKLHSNPTFAYRTRMTVATWGQKVTRQGTRPAEQDKSSRPPNVGR